MGAPLVMVENFRAMFYAPFYLAHTTGAYAAERVRIDLQASPSPAASGRRLAEGSADITWGGPLRVLLDHEADPASDVRCFHAVVCRDPFFLIGAAPAPGFAVADLLGKRLGTVSEVPTPWICLEQDLREARVDPPALTRVADGTMAGNADALRAGRLDVVQVFQPYAEQLIRDGAGHIWAAAADRGPTAYTTLVARVPTLTQRREKLEGMARAMRATLAMVAAMPGIALARDLRGQFPDLAPAVLGACIERYKALGLWDDDPGVLRDGFAWLRGAMLGSGVLRQGAAFGDCVDLVAEA